jgi:hypothetical protein
VSLPFITNGKRQTKPRELHIAWESTGKHSPDIFSKQCCLILLLYRLVVKKGAHFPVFLQKVLYANPALQKFCLEFAQDTMNRTCLSSSLFLLCFLQKVEDPELVGSWDAVFRTQCGFWSPSASHTKPETSQVEIDTGTESMLLPFFL